MNGAADCRDTLRRGSSSFFTAALLLPSQVREAATALYAFCRSADDLVDLAPDIACGLSEATSRLDAIYAGAPTTAADGAFAEVVARFRLPRALPDALLEGFGWDVAGRRYADLNDLSEYAMRVAGSVGLMMAAIMGVRDETALAHAAELGCAMQLTNIARDVGEDAAAGRLYLPMDWLAEAGIDPGAWLAAPQFSPALGGVVRRLLAEADRRYARAALGTAALPLACRPAIRAASALYAAIGDEVARHGHDSVTSRAVVPMRRKLGRLLRPAPRLAAPATRSPTPMPVHPLVRVMASRTVSARPRLIDRVDGRLGWTAQLFAELGRNAQHVHSARGGRHVLR